MSEEKGFLVITRREKESIVISFGDGQKVEIFITKIKGNQTRVALRASSDNVKISCGEPYKLLTKS